MPSSTTETFRLYLVRHAHASWGMPGISDFDRPLDDMGRAEARDIAEQAALADYRPDVLVTSPALRCKQTTSILLDVFRAVRPIEDVALYSSGLDAYVSQIMTHSAKGSLMIVGHNPTIETLVLEICRDNEVMAPLSMGYPTAGLTAIDIKRPIPAKLGQSGEAIAFLSPSLT